MSALLTAISKYRRAAATAVCPGFHAAHSAAITWESTTQQPGSRTLFPARPLAAFAILLALLAPACEKKQSSLKTVPPVLVPSIESQPAPAPQPAPAANAAPAPPSPPAAPPEEEEVQKPHHKPHKSVRARPEPKPAEPLKPEIAKPQPPPEPPKPAAPDSSVQITAAVPSAAVQSQKQSTEQMLRSSQAKLSGLNRALSDSEQAMAAQARNYMTQSAQAIQEGDVERAYNLAVKASLLADELSK